MLELAISWAAGYIMSWIVEPLRKTALGQKVRPEFILVAFLIPVGIAAAQLLAPDMSLPQLLTLISSAVGGATMKVAMVNKGGRVKTADSVAAPLAKNPNDHSSR